MPDAVDQDVKQGAFTTWKSFVETTAAVSPDKCFAGPLPGQPCPPYMQLDCVQDGERQIFTGFGPGADYLDYRKLIVRFWAVGETALAPLVGLAQAAFMPTFVIPVGQVLHSLPGNEMTADDKSLFEGNPVWRAEVEFKLMLQRTAPPSTLTPLEFLAP